MTAQSAGLVAKWRRIAAGDRRDGDEFSANRVETCASELEAALAAPAADGVLSDAQCDAIYNALDDWALELDSYDFGLPRVAGDGVVGGRKVIRDALAAAAAPQAQGVR